MSQEKEKTNRPLALILTIAYHAVLLVIFLLFVFKTPIPPYPIVGGGGGLEVNFGTSDNGTGEQQPEEYIPIDIKIQNQSTHQVAKSNDEQILTDETEKTAVVKVDETKKKKKDNDITKEEETKPTAPVINDPVVNTTALYKKKAKGGSEGETGKPGDQGNIKGSMDAKNHYGDPGSGGGTGGGQGTGNGTGIGSGSGPGVGTASGVGSNRVSGYKLQGRKHRFLPTPPKISIERQEIIVVKIWVDRNGDVTRVLGGEKGTSTTNQKLIKIAEELAIKSKFDSNPDALELQTGTITYIFTH